jgi:hypothetical protein
MQVFEHRRASRLGYRVAAKGHGGVMVKHRKSDRVYVVEENFHCSPRED